MKEIAITSKINEEYPELIPRLNAFDTEYDKSTGYHKTKILMEISYCTLSTLSKAIKQCKLEFSEEELIIFLHKISEAFCKL